MLDTTAFKIQKKLKTAGYKVGIEDQPNVCVQALLPGVELVALVGPKDMTKDAVEACLVIIRLELYLDKAPYTIETAGNKSRRFPESSFAAW